MDIKKVKEMARQITVAVDALAKENENLKTQNVLLAQYVAERLPTKNNTPIQKLGLSDYAVRCLRRREIEFAEQVPNDKKELMRIRGIGEQTADEILKIIINKTS